MKCILVHSLLVKSSALIANMRLGSCVSPVTDTVLPLSVREVHLSVTVLGLWAYAVQFFLLPCLLQRKPLGLSLSFLFPDSHAERRTARLLLLKLVFNFLK